MIPVTAIDQMTGGRIGIFDVACPLCGPERRSPANRARKVLRIWRLEPEFASYHCVRCGENGQTNDQRAARPDPAKLARARAAAAERERIAVAERLGKARWLWSCRAPIAGSTAETYLRDARGYGGPLPATLGFLRGRGDFPPAMIATFGISEEPEPGLLAISDTAVTGVHITRIAPDGRGKAGTERDKIMIGKSRGSPIMLASANDLLGLVVSEGIEDALSAHEATGLGAWAAGCASRLPALADVIPLHIEALTILVDDDRDGRRYSTELAHRVAARGIDVRQVILGLTGRIAA
jgi:Toprim domain